MVLIHFQVLVALVHQHLSIHDLYTATMLLPIALLKSRGGQATVVYSRGAVASVHLVNASVRMTLITALVEGEDRIVMLDGGVVARAAAHGEEAAASTRDQCATGFRERLEAVSQTLRQKSVSPPRCAPTQLASLLGLYKREVAQLKTRADASSDALYDDPNAREIIAFVNKMKQILDEMARVTGHNLDPFERQYARELWTELGRSGFWRTSCQGGR